MQHTHIPELASVLAGADHVDVKIVEGEASLRQFIAAMLSYQPGWVTFLYQVRGVFVRLLGMRQEGVPSGGRMRSEDVPMSPGEKAASFNVRLKGGTTTKLHAWFVDARDKDLCGAFYATVRKG